MNTNLGMAAMAKCPNCKTPVNIQDPDEPCVRIIIAGRGGYEQYWEGMTLYLYPPQEYPLACHGDELIFLLTIT